MDDIKESAELMARIERVAKEAGVPVMVVFTIFNIHAKLYPPPPKEPA